MRRLCDLYIRWAGLIGALYCVVPTAAWFVGMFAMLPFRQVYVLRAVLSLVGGSAIGAYLNRFGMRLWLIKHGSTEGPATAADGMLIGAAIGAGIAFPATLTSLIGSNHLCMARGFIILSCAGAALVGALFGVILGTIGRKHIAAGSKAVPEGEK